MRLYIANYYKDLYKIENISTENAYDYYEIDERDFIKINGRILWVIGIINTNNKNIRLEVSFSRNEAIMVKVIKAYIKKGNYIVTDGWSAYGWLDNPFSGYIHSIHNHGHILDSTSHIEGLWSVLKNIIKNIYNYLIEFNFKKLL